MQKISFGNKDYVKASEIAKRFRYTQDYVGQLCRSKKVEARLVGRTWYVEPDSVAAYRKTKHSSQKGAATKVSFNTKTKRPKNPKPVAPVLRSKTLKSTSTPPANRKAALSVSYSPDTQETVPALKTKVTLPVKSTPITTTEKPASATPSKPSKTIKIKKTKSKSTTFTTEKMPEISLSGNVDVHEIIKSDETLETLESRDQLQAASQTQSDINESNHTETTTKPDHVPPQIQFAPKSQINSRSTKAAHTQTDKSHAKTPSINPVSKFLHSDTFLVLSLILGVASALAILLMSSLGEIAPGNNNSWSLFLNVSLLQDFVM